MNENIVGDPRFICELKESYIMFGNHQYFPGYVIQFSKEKYKSLNDATLEKRSQFLLETSIIGDALLHLFETHRINYYTLGNTLEELHTHIFPRYAWEDEDLVKQPVYNYKTEVWTSADFRFDTVDFSLEKQEMEKIIINKLNEVKDIYNDKTN